MYGRLAGSECYGKIAPKGASCQVTSKDIERVFHLVDQEDGSSRSLSLGDFQQDIEQADFQWPLKPYGIEKSLTKTATMNKGAETRIFMDELEARGLYDKRNPTGPLPTSLRPQLNALLQRERIDPVAFERIFYAMGGTAHGIGIKQLHSLVSAHPIDYYEFLDLIGKEAIQWPY